MPSLSRRVFPGILRYTFQKAFRLSVSEFCAVSVTYYNLHKWVNIAEMGSHNQDEMIKSQGEKSNSWLQGFFAQNFRTVICRTLILIEPLLWAPANRDVFPVYFWGISIIPETDCTYSSNFSVVFLKKNVKEKVLKWIVLDLINSRVLKSFELCKKIVLVGV